MLSKVPTKLKGHRFRSCVVQPFLLLRDVKSFFFNFYSVCLALSCVAAPQWGAADAEIKVPSGENAELKRSPFKAWSRLL